MAKPLITVLIDTYNYGQFVREAIESVLAQDFPLQDVEILVVDDGSTDNTREVVAKYGGRVEYLYKENGGQASAFNYGVERARGELLALLDADDYWLPAKLHCVTEEFARNPDAGLVYHPFRELRMDTGEWRDGDFNAVSGDVAANEGQILLYTACQTSGLTFRTELVRKIFPLNEGLRIQADGILAAMIIFLAPVVAVPAPLAVYRIHGSNLYYQSTAEVDPQRQRRRIETFQVFLQEMDRWLTEHGFDLRRREILAFRTRWKLVYETEEFLLEEPGRLRFFWHLVRAMENMNPCLTWRIQAVNAINAMGSLFVGYKRYGMLDDWRLRLKVALGGSKRDAK
jgi:glycosyltransferase involved in cell wall biosynthesis